MWTGDANIFFNCLIKTGWLDDDNGTILIHDWYDYAGKLLDMRKKNAEKQKRHRDKVRNSDVTVTSPLRNRATVPYRTLPYQVEDSIITNTLDSASDENGALQAPAQKKVKEDKKTFGEFENVKLTEAEHEKLIERFGAAGTENWIHKLSSWKESKGKKTKSDYATILNWKEREQENGGNGSGNRSGVPRDRVYTRPEDL